MAVPGEISDRPWGILLAAYGEFRVAAVSSTAALYSRLTTQPYSS